MTLFEAVTALVILGLSAVGYLELYHGGGRSLRNAHEWTHLVAIAESVMEEETLGGDVAREAGVARVADGYSRHVERLPWRGRVQEVVVTVESPNGVRFALHRLHRYAPGQ